MMPRSPSPDVVERRLAHQRELLGELRKLLPITADDLRTQAVTRAAIERMMQAVVDLALDINSHLASAVLLEAPATGRESFDLMVRAGVLTAELSDGLKPAVGFRNILVHLYADIDVTLVADAAPAFERTFSEYVRAVAVWLLANSDAPNDSL
jgi:uncharacterized protein YutE (UPF0331/DUF86 family)